MRQHLRQKQKEEANDCIFLACHQSNIGIKIHVLPNTQGLTRFGSHARILLSRFAFANLSANRKTFGKKLGKPDLIFAL